MRRAVPLTAEPGIMAVHSLEEVGWLGCRAWNHGLGLWGGRCGRGCLVGR
jgi:hypothetical protein